jgi:hypothetical protein
MKRLLLFLLLLSPLTLTAAPENFFLKVSWPSYTDPLGDQMNVFCVQNAIPTISDLIKTEPIANGFLAVPVTMDEQESHSCMIQAKNSSSNKVSGLSGVATYTVPKTTPNDPAVQIECFTDSALTVKCQ